MTVTIICVKGHEDGNETIRGIETISDVTNNAGTFLNIAHEGGLITSVWKKYIERVEVTA